MFGAAFVFAATPYLVVSFGHISQYIWNTLVEQKEFWAYRAGLDDHLVFYVKGPGGGFISLLIGFKLELALFVVRIGLAVLMDRNESGP